MADEFTVPIKGNTKDLLTKLKEATQRITSFGKDAVQAVRAPKDELTEFTASLSSFGSFAKTALAGLVGGIGLKSLTKDFMDYHANLSNAVQLMNYDVSQVEAMGSAMRRFGGDTSGAVSSLDNLSSALQQARYGQGALVEVGAKFGVSYMKSNGQLMNTQELLGSLTKQLNKYDRQTKIAIASQLGLDQALLRVIDTGNFDTLIENQKKLNLTTAQDLKLATDMESAWLDLKDTFSGLAKEVSRVLIPPLTKLMRWSTDLLKGLKDFQNKGALAWGAIGLSIIPVLAKVKSMVTAFQGLGMVTGLLKSIQSGFSAFSSALSLALSPLGLIALAFLAIFLICEDLYTYFTGGDSLFGRLADEYPAVKMFLDALGAVIGGIKDAVGYFFDFLANPSWEGFIDMLVKIKDKAIQIFEGVALMVVDIMKAPFDLVGNVMDKTADLVGGALEKGWDFVKGLNPFSSSQPSVSNVPASVLTGSSGDTTIDNKQVTINNEVTINAQGMSPEAIPSVANEALQKIQRTAVTYQ